MRRIIIVSLFFAGIVISHAKAHCDTLKIKIVKSYYTELYNGTNLRKLGELNNAVINIDTLPVFYLGADIVNVSSDIFFVNEEFVVQAGCISRTDIGTIREFWYDIDYFFGRDFLPNDTVRIGIYIKVDLPALINRIKEEKGIDFEQITYWQMIIGVGYTEKDGYYSDSVFYAGADTSIFYVVKGAVGIEELQVTSKHLQVFPNPAQTHFTVTNTEHASLYLYNVLGQEVWRAYSAEIETHCNASLPQGLYVIKVVKNGVSSTHKVVVRD
jgi:hypothetical protein